MSTLKYINFETLGLVIFEQHNGHDQMAQKIRDKPVSAGFCFLPLKDADNNTANCFGKSTSLGIESNEKDTKLLRRHLNPYRW